jgi:aspartate aminotransferase-like enzyme
MAETFRVGCIGSLDAEIMARAVQVIGAVLEEMGVVNRSPSARSSNQLDR